ncbi:DNA repair protein RecN [Thiomicrorhabdus sp. 6S3-12]|uniref:DNA repair protein RecN n=1 Tax=Thiomicrorhabdus sp. 6S3-12 TaxID=2819681 RepID=UPI001AADE390|nr:DNA repair protein RecN [Thiomicrorhabdus sp. 6S3-12]MBO1924153.1 DNA repair protein RecN [Thiomicrorhabdus sp. 6S3-12]
MLSELSIQNLALIEKLNLNFSNGFSSLTGETGAGKSILLDALGLTLGERADSSLVRHGSKRADISAAFDLSQLPHVQLWLQENELDDENSCLLRRTVSAEGRSKAYINGIPVAVAQLKTLSNLLIDIHGQHEHQSLLHSGKQLALLDAFAAHTTLLEQTRDSFKQWKSLQQQLSALEQQQQDFQSRFELLSFQQQEFAELSPVEDEFEELELQQNQLSHASEIKRRGLNAYDHLEAEQGASDQINHAIHHLEEVVAFCPQFEAPLAQLNSALIEIQEAAAEIQTTAENIELDPNQLEAVEERLSALFSIAKKYMIEPSQLPQKQQQIEEALNTLQHSGESLEQLRHEIKQQEADFHAKAHKLRASRQKAAKKLSRQITEGMQELGMANGVFEVALEASKTPAQTGVDQIDFKVSANKGQPIQPLAKVASGGELSRISLAIQVATAEVAQLPTLIFDEVDVGIGGGIAEVVGEKMRQLGEHKQILSITHLAQVAAHGNHHFKIAKSTRAEMTHTEVNYLDSSQRIEELARMLGGMKITEQTQKMAQEMLSQAQEK